MSTRTHDTLFAGLVTFDQPARGYRANVDAILLAAFATRAKRPARDAFDLGAGAGAVGLSLLHLGGARHVVFVESDESAAACASDNVRARARDGSERAEVVTGDVLVVARAHKSRADLVVCNPPYVEPGKGRTSANEARARARSGELATFVAAARLLAGKRARACFVYPARDLTHLFAVLRDHGLEPKRLRHVHATASSPARVVLVEALVAKPGGLVIEPPLVEREGTGYSAELAALLAAPRPSD